METRRGVASGLAEVEARRDAQLRFGGVDDIRERMRDGRGLRWVDDARQDVRFALRSLRKRPGFAAAGIITIALGIGATSSVVSVANALLFRPLPVTDPGSLVVLQERRSGDTSSGIEGEKTPFSRYLGYQSGSGSVFAGTAAYQYRGFSLSVDGAATPVSGALVSSTFFDVLGVRASFGRVIDSRAADAVISDMLWRTRFGGRRDVIGRTILIDGQTYSVVGVAPHAFRGITPPLAQDIWVSYEAYRFGSQAGSSDRWVAPFARLASGVNAERAGSVANAIAARMPVERGTVVKGVQLDRMTGLPRDARTGLKAGMAMLLCTALLVLLIASANIAGLLLTQGVSRRREIAVRLAMGAGRMRLLRQLQTESLVLFLLGGSLGIVLAVFATNAYSRISFPVPFTLDLKAAPDVRVVIISLMIAALSALIFGMTPALSAARRGITEVLKDGGRTGSAGGNRVRSIFVSGQLAVSVLLLILAGLFVRSLQRAAGADLGIEPGGVVVGSLDLASNGYDATEAPAFLVELSRRLRALPGVSNVAVSDNVMLSASRNSGSVALPADTSRAPGATFFKVDAPFMETMGIRLVAGRAFRDADAKASPPAIIINETLSRLLWPNESPLGKELEANGRKRYTVVGVARDGKYYMVTEKPTPVVFFALPRAYTGVVAVHVQSSLPAGVMLRQLRTTINAIDPGIALQGASSMESIATSTLMAQKSIAWVVGVFGVFGLILAGLGVYGVLAFQVAQRTREFGIRKALGARSRDVLLNVVASGGKLALIGAVTGGLLAVGAARVIRGFLYGVDPLDRLTFLAVPLTLSIVALAASYLPALRAMRVSPTESLRSE